MDSNGSGEVQFTVIIPAYNAKATIERALQSVLTQSYPATQIIVVDDASTDGTSTLLEKYADSIQLIQHVINAGSSVTRNTAMNRATGNYIAFLDADDVWHPDKLNLISQILRAKPDIMLFFHPFTQEDMLHKRLPEDVTLYKLPFIKLLPANMIATSCAVIRNSKEFRFEPTMRYTEDYDLWLRIGYQYRIYFIKIPLTRIFRPFLSSGGISSNQWKMRRGEMRAYSRLVRLNPLFAFLWPFLMVSSLGKFGAKKVAGLFGHNK
jgi:teichuronic acid biosynthesis glycosyltransferase TuaG